MNIRTRPSTSDEDIKTNVLAEFGFEPSVKASEIGVLVKDGTVTLNGHVSSYWDKSRAVFATKRVLGVNGIADEIKVKLPGTVTHTDSDIAAAAAQQLKWHPSVPENSVQLIVRDGWIELDGQVEWWYQKNAAEDAVHFLSGVQGVTNQITIKPRLSATNIESDIQSAFKRNAMIDGDEIAVTTSGNTAILNGNVRSLAEKHEAERAAWDAAGVTSVDNRLTVNWTWLGD